MTDLLAHTQNGGAPGAARGRETGIDLPRYVSALAAYAEAERRAEHYAQGHEAADEILKLVGLRSIDNVRRLPAQQLCVLVPMPLRIPASVAVLQYAFSAWARSRNHADVRPLSIELFEAAQALDPSNFDATRLLQTSVTSHRHAFCDRGTGRLDEAQKDYVTMKMEAADLAVRNFLIDRIGFVPGEERRSYGPPLRGPRLAETLWALEQLAENAHSRGRVLHFAGQSEAALKQHRKAANYCVAGFAVSGLAQSVEAIATQKLDRFACLQEVKKRLARLLFTLRDALKDGNLPASKLAWRIEALGNQLSETAPPRQEVNDAGLPAEQFQKKPVPSDYVLAQPAKVESTPAPEDARGVKEENPSKPAAIPESWAGLVREGTSLGQPATRRCLLDGLFDAASEELRHDFSAIQSAAEEMVLDLYILARNSGIGHAAFLKECEDRSSVFVALPVEMARLQVTASLLSRHAGTPPELRAAFGSISKSAEGHLRAMHLGPRHGALVSAFRAVAADFEKNRLF